MGSTEFLIVGIELIPRTMDLKGSNDLIAQAEARP